MSDDRWQQLADSIISAAEEIDCDFSEFVEGLKTIEIAIRERREGAETELDT